MHANKRKRESVEDVPSAKCKTKDKNEENSNVAEDNAHTEDPMSVFSDGSADVVILTRKEETKRISGTLLFSGATNWDLVGRRAAPKTSKNATGPNLYGPHTLAALKGIRVVVAVSSNTACHSIIITDDGKVMTWGRNETAQLGVGDTERRDTPCLVETFQHENIISAACGRGHTLFLSDKGAVYACGNNKMGQCGNGSKTLLLKTPVNVKYHGRPLKIVACGAQFSVIVDGNGRMYTFGCPEYGQLGHNTDGQYFITSSKLDFQCELEPRRIIAYVEKNRDVPVSLVHDVQIVKVACGPNHTIAMDSKKRCFSWGFGGYGRLGHAEQKDEKIPRLIKTFDGPNRGVKDICAGGTFSMAVNEHDVLYFWGQTRQRSDANMYPKPVSDLSGWKIRSMAGSNTSIVIASGETVIAYGPSPTYGELCYGDGFMKSSVSPQEAKPLIGMFIHRLSCGVGHTLLIARDDTEDEIEKLTNFPEFAP